LTTVPTRLPGLKRRLLAGAVDDNVRAIRNQPRGRLYRRAPLPWTLLLVGAAGVAAAFALGAALRSGAIAPAAPPSPYSRLPVESGPDKAGPEAVFAAGPLARVPSRVFPLAVRRIVIDPGHGGGDEGTHTSTGLVEKDLTLDISKRLAARLRAAGIQPLLTRERDERVSLADRAAFANRSAADLFVSIHVNWFRDGRADRGIETFYLGPSDDPFVTRLASDENRESGYSLADVRRLLDSIYADLRQEESRQLAADVQKRLLASVREVEPAVRDRGVKSAPFLVLVATDMPAILAEVACLSNDEEARLLGRPDYRDRIAGALFDGIAAYSRDVQRSGPATTREESVR
jgi:N-acetylmuramoyl-L-alanine amidase